MKLKSNRLFPITLVITLLSSASPFAHGKTFCEGRMPNYGTKNENGVHELTGELSTEYCYEILDDEVLAHDISIVDGSRISVVGKMTNSVVEENGFVIISRTILTAGDGYQEDQSATGNKILIKKGGEVRVHDGGSLIDSTINGIAYISNQSEAQKNAPGISKNNIVSNGGKLMVYKETIPQPSRDTAEAYNTKVNDGGELYVYKEGKSHNTEINKGGIEYVQQGGISINTTVNSGGIQHVNNNGKAYNALVSSGGKQIVNASSTVENTILNNGHLYIYSGSLGIDTTLKEKSVGWLSEGAKSLGKTEVNQQSILQLTTGSNQLNSLNSGSYVENLLLNDQNSTLKILRGNSGKYAHIEKLSGQGKIKFDTTPSSGYAHLNIHSITGSQIFYMNTSIAEDKGDYITITEGSGNHKLGVKDSGVEITKPEETTLDLVSDYSGGATFNLAKIDGVNIDAVDGGTYLYYLHDRDENGEKIWYLSAEKQIDPDPTDPNPIDPTPPILETTPSTDAVISLASAPQLIMANEMNNLRFRKGSVKANTESAGVWGRVIGDSTKINEGPAHFDLEQMGLEIGADTVLTLDSGSLLLGGMANYSWSDVKHHRGGKSKVDSYSLGLYATYFFDNGFYLDGVLKYNHFDNELRARSTQGDIVSSDYSQHGYGLSLEAGYDWDLVNNLWIEPYGKLSYISVNSKDIKLSNGMEAHIGSHDSLTSELGFSFGKDFNLENSTIFSPYVKFAWNHEFIDDNKVRINNRHDFVNDFSGDHIKAGVGFNAKIQDDLSLFGEVNYRSGSYIDDSVQANFGIRYNF